MRWKEEFWKLFGAFGQLWRTNELNESEKNRIRDAYDRLERKYNRSESDVSRLLNDNNRLRNDNLRLRGLADLAETNVENETADKILAALDRVKAA